MDVLRSKPLIGISSAFVFGLLLGMPASGLLAGEHANSAAVSDVQLAKTLATINTRMQALERSNSLQRVGQNYRVILPAGRPAGIQVTSPQGSDSLTMLQQRVTSLETSLFGTTAPGGRPGSIKSDVIDGMEQKIDGLEMQMDQLKKTISQETSKLDAIRNDLASIHATGDATAKTVSENNISFFKLRSAFLGHQHRINGAKAYKFPVDGIMRVFPGTQGEDPSFTLEPYCGAGYPNYAKCEL